MNIKGYGIEIFEESNDSYFDRYLKEINIGLLNKIYKKKYIIRFFYLLRDDIFIFKDRTKFFDFIIPIYKVRKTSLKT